MADRLNDHLTTEHTREDETLSRLVSFYEDSVEATRSAREQAERDRDYYDHKQLTDDQIAELSRRKQAPTIVNFIHKNVNYLLGIERQTRTDPKAFPRTPVHEEAAHAASDAIRYVCDDVNFEVTASNAYKNLLIEGLGAVVVEAKAKKLDDFDITVKRIEWDRVFFDPHCREENFSDAQYLGYIQWMDLKEAKRFAKDNKYTGDLTEDESAFAETFEDKPSFKTWFDGKRKRVKLSYIWFLDKGIWKHAIYTKAGIIWGPEPCPYEDENGDPECNFIVQSALVDRENNRYGYVRAMISQQDSINKRESKALHLLSQRQTWAKAGTFKSVQQAKAELAKPDGHVELNEHAQFGTDFGILSTGDMATGQFTLLQEAKRDLDQVAATGSIVNAANQSGRALEARAQSGSIELTVFTDAHKQLKKRVYRCIWNKIRQYWKAEKWVRVTDDENNLKWVGLNTPITVAEQMIMQHTGLTSAEVKKQFSQQIAMAIAQNPAMGELVTVENPVAELDVDIILDEAPDVINLQAEQFQIIASIAERRGDIPTPLIIKMSSLRNKEQILDELTGDDQQKESAAQAQAMAQQAQMTMLEAELAEKQAKTAKTEQEAIQKMLENAAIEQFQPLPLLSI